MVIPKGVGRWEAGLMAFHAFHTPSFPWPALETRTEIEVAENTTFREPLVRPLWEGVLCMRSTIKLIIASPTLLSILCLSCAKGPSPGSTSLCVINRRPSLPRLRHPHAHETLSLHGPKLITGSKGRRSREFHQLFGLRISNPG
jgi:hypothetical protein